MSHNRIDTNRHTSTASLRKAGQSTSVAKTPSTAQGERPLGQTDAVSTESVGAFEAVRGETSKLDGARLADLSDKIDRGEYRVDPSQLADRIIDDALGPEGG